MKRAGVSTPTSLKECLNNSLHKDEKAFDRMRRKKSINIQYLKKLFPVHMQCIVDFQFLFVQRKSCRRTQQSHSSVMLDQWADIEILQFIQYTVYLRPKSVGLFTCVLSIKY